MNPKDKYRELCIREKSIPIFAKDWWLDTLAGEDNWDVVIVEQNGEIVASMPYVKKKKGIFFNVLTVPVLTQYLGIWYRQNAVKYEKILPFYWKGFKQSTSYTYVLEDLTDLDQVYNRSSQSKTLLTWEAIKFASAMGRTFDFEGSMIVDDL